MLTVFVLGATQALVDHDLIIANWCHISHGCQPDGQVVASTCKPGKLDPHAPLGHWTLSCQQCACWVAPLLFNASQTLKNESMFIDFFPLNLEEFSSCIEVSPFFSHAVSAVRTSKPGLPFLAPILQSLLQRSTSTGCSASVGLH